MEQQFQEASKMFLFISQNEEPLPPPDTCYNFPCLDFQACSRNNRVDGLN